MIQPQTQLASSKWWCLHILLMCACILFSALASAQTIVNPLTMTRSKMWIRTNPNGSLERELNLGLSGHDFELAYPGYWDNRNEASGGWNRNAVYNGAQVRGEDVCWIYRNGNFDDLETFAITQTFLVKNYNLVNPRAPEEYIQGVIGSDTMNSSGRRHMGYKLDGMVMGWSQTGFSDFLIIKCKLTSTDPDTLKNFYYARYISPTGPYRPSSVSSGWDKEYMWDPSISDTLGFIFYDQSTMSPISGIPTYSIFPGNVTGNSGDPGNIGTQNSRDMKLYSPSLYAYTFVPNSSMTPNKYGERKVWRRVVSNSSNAPIEENMPTWNTELATYATLVDFLTNENFYPQPHVNWRTAYDSIQRGFTVPGAGSLWERNPRYVYGIGPYDIPPGGSIEWVEIFICGQMDRNLTMLGDTTSTLHFVDEGLKNLKKNWANARSLIESRYVFPRGKVPPPTPADAPLVGNTDTLSVLASQDISSGSRVAGVQLRWKAVHVNYRDPQTTARDFAAYKVYKSNNSIEGPWIQIDSIPIAQADSLRHLGSDTMKITYFTHAEIGIPYRYCVTSIDTSGNECGMTGYSFYPIAAEPNPSNNLSGIVVVPNPFKQVSGFNDQAENKRLAFYNIPSKCTIRIYTLALELIKTLEHDGAGLQTWGNRANQDYMLTDFGQNIMPGIYIYQCESHVPGHEGETSVGKFAVIR